MQDPLCVRTSKVLTLAFLLKKLCGEKTKGNATTYKDPLRRRSMGCVLRGGGSAGSRSTDRCFGMIRRSRGSGHTYLRKDVWCLFHGFHRMGHNEHDDFQVVIRRPNLP